MNDVKIEPKNDLGKFLEKYRVDKNQSRREFARHIHTSPDTLVRMIEEGEPPTIKFLRSVSGYTGKGLLALLQMAFPNEIREPTAEELATAQKIHVMPEPRRSWFIELIDNSDTRGTETSGDEGEIRVVKKRK